MFLLSLPEAMCLHDVWKDDVPSSGTLPPCLYCRHSVCFWGLLWKWWTVEGGAPFPYNHFTYHAEKYHSSASCKYWVFITED